MGPEPFNEQIEKFCDRISQIQHKYAEKGGSPPEAVDSALAEISKVIQDYKSAHPELLRQQSGVPAGLAKFPEENPNPILRIDLQGVIYYANSASRVLLDSWGLQVGQTVSQDWIDRVRQVAGAGEKQALDLAIGSQWFSFILVPILEFGYINIYGQEITERKQMENHLADQADLLESVHDAIIAVDGQLTITSWNHAAEELYGWTQQEAVGQNVSLLLRSELVGQARETVLKQLAQDGLFIGEVIHHARDGRRLTIESHTRVRKDAAGQVVGYIIANRDISERRKIGEEREQLLTENQRQKSLLDAIFEADPGGLAVVVGDRMEFVYANPAYRFLCPHNGADPIGQPYEHVWSAADLNCFSGPIREVVETGRPFQTQGFERHFPDGACRIFTLQARRIDWDHRPAALIALWDTTEARQAEQLIRESERREATILASITDCCYLLDSQWRITRINDPALNIFHKTSQELLGHSFWEIFPQAKGTVIEEHYLRAVREQTQQHYESLSPISGLWVEVHAYPSSEGMFVIFRDITSRRQGEETLGQLLTQVEHQAAELTALFDAMTDVVVLYDAHGKPVRANQAAIRAYGFNPCETEWAAVIQKMPLRHPNGDLYRTEDLPSLRAIRGETISAEKAIFTNLAGEERIILMFATPVFTPDQHLTGLVLVWHDITEMEQAANLLVRYHLLYETTQEIILFVRLADGRIQEANRAAEIAYGYSREELLSLTIADLRAPDTRVQIGSQMTEAATNGIQFETRHCKKDGTIFYVQVSSMGADLGGERVNLSIVRDITESKQAEYALTAQREWFRTTLSSIGDAVITTDAHGRVTFLNPIAEQITGWADADALGQPMQRVFPIFNELTRQPAEDPVGKVLRHGGIVGLANHTALMSRDGRVIPIEDSAAPIQTAAGEMLGVVMVFHDVTEKRKAEDALLRSELRYRSLYENDLDGCLLTQPDGTILSANPQACRMLGMTEAEICQAGRAGVVVESGHLASLLNEGNRAAKGHGELAFRRKDGSTFVAEVSSSVYAEPDGSLKTSLTIHDITDRKQAEQAIQKSEERYRSLFAGMTEGFALHEIICDETGTPVDYRFLDLNPAFEQLTGLKRENVAGRLLSEVLPGEDPKWVEMYGKVALTGEPVHFESHSPVLKKDYHVFSYRPAPRQFAVIFMDITERKRSEIEYRSSMVQIELQRRLLEQREQERQQIARDLHDGPVQELTGAHYALDEILSNRESDTLVDGLQTIRQS
ncbi:MAG TPA: PAS domain S-box protein, partial [Anaerolineaceae bacterium]